MQFYTITVHSGEWDSYSSKTLAHFANSGKARELQEELSFLVFSHGCEQEADVRDEAAWLSQYEELERLEKLFSEAVERAGGQPVRLSLRAPIRIEITKQVLI